MGKFLNAPSFYAPGAPAGYLTTSLPRSPLSPAAWRTYHTLILSASLCSFVSCLMQKVNASEQNELGSVEKAWFCISMLYVKVISTSTYTFK